MSTPSQPSFSSESSMPVEQIKLSLIETGPQIRTHFDAEKLGQLGESIKEHGLVQPIVVAPTANGFKLIAGERRLRAAQGAGIKHLPTIVRHDLKDQDPRVLQAIENLQRENLTQAEECAGVIALVDSLGFEATCQQLSKSPSWVSKRANVRELPSQIKELVEQGQVKDLEVAHGLGQLAKFNPTKAFCRRTSRPRARTSARWYAQSARKQI